jgi:dienelactone hydrolase
MSEPEIATKAPESDTAQASPFPRDSQAQAGASMGEHCTTDRPTTGQRPTGEMTMFKDIEVYVSKPADYPHSPSKLLLLLTGGTGVKSTNNQLQADIYASHGFVVVMPDQFSGDPASTTTTSVEENPSLLEQVKLKAAETIKSFMIDMWLARHTPEKVLPIIHTVLDSAKDEYADAVANGGGIYAAGYCFGAKYVIMLAGEHPDTVASGQQPKDEEAGVVSKGPLIKAGAIAHATLVTKQDLLALKAPVSMACVGQSEVAAEQILR